MEHDWLAGDNKCEQHAVPELLQKQQVACTGEWRLITLELIACQLQVKTHDQA